MLSTHGAAGRDSFPPPPFVNLEEQLEGGLRHCTPSCKALSVCHGETVVAGHQPSPSSPPTQTCHLHQHKQWFLLTICENQVPTGDGNPDIKCKLVSPLHTPGEQPAPVFHAGFHQTLIFINNNIPRAVQGAGRQQRGCSIRGKHHQHWLLSQPQPPPTQQ